MKIKNWFLSGDTHGWRGLCDRLAHLHFTGPGETALIILGDAGLNYWLNKTDQKGKAAVNNFEHYVYCVRGNHEQRPELIPTMKKIFDDNVENFVWYEEKFPYIRYLIDGCLYIINNLRTLVIGGAYSVDKWWRLANGNQWFEHEQLSLEEREIIENTHTGYSFDLVLTHTCPYSWRPTDLFLSTIDQASVDTSMELWLDEFKDKITWGTWAFGHYHDDRLERPNVIMLYHKIININDLTDPNLERGPQYNYE